MESRINNNVSFTAKLNVKALKNNKTRWKNIADEFERQTLKETNDTLVLSNDTELEIAKQIEFIVGKEVMEKLYLRADLKALVDKLSKYTL